MPSLRVRHVEMLSSNRKSAADSPRCVAATAYCDHGITDSGARARRGSVAADPRVIPLGSTIRVEGLQGAPDGTYSVLDTGRTIKGREIDVFIPRCGAAKAFGRQQVRVKILKRGPMSKS